MEEEDDGVTNINKYVVVAQTSSASLGECIADGCGQCEPAYQLGVFS